MRKLKKSIWPHKVTIKDKTGDGGINAAIWLNQMGIYKGRWNFIILFGSVEFYFKDGKDATLFALRWA